VSNDKTNFAILVDLENAGGKVSMLESIIEKVKIRGDILIGKVYGYTEGYASLKETLLSNTFQVVPSIRFGANQKNHLDIELVIDALEIAYSNPLIDSFCIVSGDSDYTPLVGKLKSMGKIVLGISRSECASNVFIKACNEFIFLESVSKQATPPTDTQDQLAELNDLVCTVLDEQSDSDGYVYASELKNVLLRLKPEFNEKSYGKSTFGKLVQELEKRFGDIRIVNDEFAVKISRRADQATVEQLTPHNWVDVFRRVLARFKNEGFERVNPSILKASITKEYPDFDERQVGYKKFSDLLKRLERENILMVELNDAKTMLVRIL
jgi:uncharacterized protein (TIGR00288 family)